MYPSTPLLFSGQDPGCVGQSHGYILGKNLDSYPGGPEAGLNSQCEKGWGWSDDGACHPSDQQNGPPLNVCNNNSDRVLYYVKDDINGYSLPHSCSMLPLYARVFDIDQLNYYMKIKNKTVAQMTDQHANPIDYNEQYDDPQLMGQKTSIGQHCSDEIQFWNIRYLGRPNDVHCTASNSRNCPDGGSDFCCPSRSRCRGTVLGELVKMNQRSVDGRGAGGWRDYGALS